MNTAAKIDMLHARLARNLKCVMRSLKKAEADPENKIAGKRVEHFATKMADDLAAIGDAKEQQRREEISKS